VCHCGLDDRVFVPSGVEVHDQLVDQARNAIDLRALVGDLPGLIVPDVDGARPPSARPVGEGVARHHEVERLEQLRAVGEVAVLGQLQHVGHGIAVATESEPGLLACVEWFLACGDIDGIVQPRLVTLDAVRPLDRAGHRIAS
jgi:hypothetical protein